MTRPRSLRERYRRWRGSGHYVFCLVVASFAMLLALTIISVGFLVALHTNVNRALTRPATVSDAIRYTEARLRAAKSPAERAGLEQDLSVMYWLRDRVRSEVGRGGTVARGVERGGWGD